MNQGARDANEEIARQAAASRQDTQITLLREIRDLLKKLLEVQQKNLIKDSG